MHILRFYFVWQRATHASEFFCKSQLLTLFTHVCTHSCAGFYRWCKRHSHGNKKYENSTIFRDRLVKMTTFRSCIHYLQEQATWKANGILPKAVLKVSVKLQNRYTVLKIILTLPFVKNTRQGCTA